MTAAGHGPFSDYFREKVRVSLSKRMGFDPALADFASSIGDDEMQPTICNVLAHDHVFEKTMKHIVVRALSYHMGHMEDFLKPAETADSTYCKNSIHRYTPAGVIAKWSAIRLEEIDLFDGSFEPRRKFQKKPIGQAASEAVKRIQDLYRGRLVALDDAAEKNFTYGKPVIDYDAGFAAAVLATKQCHTELAHSRSPFLGYSPIDLALSMRERLNSEMTGFSHNLFQPDVRVREVVGSTLAELAAWSYEKEAPVPAALGTTLRRPVTLQAAKFLGS